MFVSERLLLTSLMRQYSKVFKYIVSAYDCTQPTSRFQALAALRASLKPESRALAMLANEVERLAGEQMRLEAHLARTDTWADHLGSWRATVHSAEVGTRFRKTKMLAS